jgi:LppP/LprE lipoprotein/META domain
VNFPRSWPLLGALVAVLCLPAQAANEGLSGMTWRLVHFQGPNGQALQQEDESSYTVEFKADNTVAVRMDCHRGRGTWLSRSTSELELGPVALTKATCARSPLNDQIAKQWTLIHSYALRDTHLFLSLTADAGAYEFEPVASPPQPPQTPPPHTDEAQPTQPRIEPWLDQSKPVSWNTSGAMLPSAPQMEPALDPRCQTLARPPELEADKRLTDLGWHLVGEYQGGWGALVIQATAGYDRMCRPRAYQVFVFLHGMFAGTLSPGTMDSRTDGALSRVSLQDGRRLVADYLRYTPSDPLCCASRTTTVVFEIDPDQAAVRPVSASTSSNR